MATINSTIPATEPVAHSRRKTGVVEYCRRHPSVFFGGTVLCAVIFMALIAPLIAGDPLRISPIHRLKPPSAEYWFGTDFLGRDIYARTIYGARISLAVGFSVAIISTLIGLVIGMVAGYIRWVDAIVMRIMDGLMAIPGVLLAIALIALAGASLTNVIIAISIPEIPRVVRLVRSVVLQIRELPYVEAAVSVGSPTRKILTRHILPNTIAPLIVQATFVCASAVVVEAILSFLGAGTPPETPSWGNVMAEGRSYFQFASWIIFFPGLFLAITVLAVNMLGDGLRDSLDPKIARRM